MNEQQEFKFAADMQYFSVFSSSVRRGIISKIGASGMCVFIAIRSLTEMNKSFVELSTKALCQVTGFSKPTVLKSINLLVEHGMLRKTQISVEKYQFQTVDVIPFALTGDAPVEETIASLDEGTANQQGNIKITYTPGLVAKNRDDALTFLQTGNAPANRFVNIENFYLTVVLDKETLLAGENIADPELRKAFLSLAKAAGHKVSGIGEGNSQVVEINAQNPRARDPSKP